MKQKIKVLVIFSIIFILFFSINSFLFKNNHNINNSIFNIISESNIMLDNTNIKNIKSENYKNIINKQIIGKGFFINSSGEFLTNKHLFDKNLSNYSIELYNNIYDFEIVKEFKNKDLILGKIINYENNNYIELLSNNSIEGITGDKVFIIKNNKILDGIITGINKEISDLNLTNLIETNIKLESGDSGSPLLNNKGEVIGINTAVKQNESISYAQIINKKTIH